MLGSTFHQPGTVAPRHADHHRRARFVRQDGKTHALGEVELHASPTPGARLVVAVSGEGSSNLSRGRTVSDPETPSRDRRAADLPWI